MALWLLLTSSSSAELQWQRGRTVHSQVASRGNLRFQRRHDTAVRPAAFDEEPVVGPRLTSGNGGRATFRSIVVEGEDASDDVRAAQLPDAGGRYQPTTPDTGTDESLEDRLGTPFGDTPQQPPPDSRDLEEGFDLDSPPPQDDTDSRLQFDNNQRQPGEQTPDTFRPFPAPDRSLPETDAEREMTSDVTTTTPEPGTTSESCRESWTRLKAKTIDTVSLSIAVTGTEGKDFPFECGIEDGSMYGGRCWPQITYLWKASALCHKPLYFEDEQLERYGHSFPPCVQPFVSGAHFFCTLPVLPYCMGVEPPMECIYALGHYRPGNCAPYMCDPIPISARGALFQAGAVVGAAAALP